MLTGVSPKKAMEYFAKGKRVLVIDLDSRDRNGQYEVVDFEVLAEQLNFLVDVPAVPDPEFEQAVKVMMGSCEAASCVAKSHLQEKSESMMNDSKEKTEADWGLQSSLPGVTGDK